MLSLNHHNHHKNKANKDANCVYKRSKICTFLWLSTKNNWLRAKFASHCHKYYKNFVFRRFSRQ
ncbi:MAG: hypothetical protein MSC50_03705 [Campylobacter sp.]|nr:hypothetical protein [Campylobacter sp.]